MEGTESEILEGETAGEKREGPSPPALFNLRCEREFEGQGKGAPRVGGGKRIISARGGQPHLSRTARGSGDGKGDGTGRH